MAEDVGAVKSTPSIFANVIIDGKVMESNLGAMNKDRDWLMRQLKIQNMDIEDVLLGTLDEKESSPSTKTLRKAGRSLFQ